jgi:hypothetical protein
MVSIHSLPWEKLKKKKLDERQRASSVYCVYYQPKTQPIIQYFSLYFRLERLLNLSSYLKSKEVPLKLFRIGISHIGWNFTRSLLRNVQIRIVKTVRFTSPEIMVR